MKINYEKKNRKLLIQLKIKKYSSKNWLIQIIKMTIFWAEQYIQYIPKVMGCNQNYRLGGGYIKTKYNEKLKKYISQGIKKT